MPRRKGTPEKLTPEVERAICQSLEIGLPQKYAAAEAGISDRTFRYWLEHGEKGTEPYAAFRAAVAQARARGAKNLLTRALKGERGSAAAMWTLERSYRAEFGANIAIGGMGDGDAIRIDSNGNDRIRENAEASDLLHKALIVMANTDAASSASQTSTSATKKRARRTKPRDKKR